MIIIIGYFRNLCYCLANWKIFEWFLLFCNKLRNWKAYACLLNLQLSFQKVGAVFFEPRYCCFVRIIVQKLDTLIVFTYVSRHHTAFLVRGLDKEIIVWRYHVLKNWRVCPILLIILSLVGHPRDVIGSPRILLVLVRKLFQELKHCGVRVYHRDSVIEFRVNSLYLGDSCCATYLVIVLKRRWFLYDLTQILILRGQL